MEITVRKLSEIQIVQIRGALRLGPGVDSFRQTIDDAMAEGDTRLVINFAEVPMIDSSGIGILVNRSRHFKFRENSKKPRSPISPYLTTSAKPARKSRSLRELRHVVSASTSDG